MNIWKELCLVLLLTGSGSYGQYRFSGQVKEELRNGRLYLSIVEDYRKLKGIHSEQILQKIQTDSTGYFVFEGNNLPLEHRIYRIHIDTCPDSDQIANHFTGHCENSREILFVANNSDHLSFPFSFDNEMFCSIEGPSQKARVFLRVDSLQNDMLFSLSSYESQASGTLNLEFWFSQLKEFGKLLEEPLGELYIYSILSEREGPFYDYYMENLDKDSYYDDLLARVENYYPDSSYAKQLEEELEADRYILNRRNASPWWVYVVIGLLIVSFLFNFFVIGKWLRRKSKPSSDSFLSNQEEKIRDLILQDKTNKEIAQELFISVSTVKTHINSLYKKMGVTSREELKSRY